MIEKRSTNYGTRAVPYLYVTASTPTKKLPCIIFLHGIGERSSTKDSTISLSVLETTDTHRALLQGMQATHNGEQFISYMPQLFTGDGNWQDWYVQAMVDLALSNPFVDTNRIYLTGLSLGGGGVLSYLCNSLNNYIAASATCCGITGSFNFCNISGKKLPMFFYHAKDDTTVGYTQSKSSMDNINSCPNNSVKAVGKWPVAGGHAIWNNFYDMNKDPFLNGVNIWEWFLMNKLGNPVPMPTPGLDSTEIPPKVIVSYSNLTGTTVDLDASKSINIAGAYNYWEVTSKPSGSSWDILVKKEDAVTQAKNLSQGSWTFSYKSNKGGVIQASDSLTIQVGTQPSKNLIATIKVYSDGSIEKI